MATLAISNEVLSYFTTMPTLELIAVFASLLYVVLAAKGNILCWLAAIVSTVLYTIIFYDVYLWMDSLLQLYYLLMAIYGWLCWSKSKVFVRLRSSNASYRQWPIKHHIIIIIVLALLSLVLGWLMAAFTPTDFPYLDSATTVFAVFATYLVTQKVLENWLYFIIIDLVSIYIYIEKGLLPTAILFAAYVILAVYGFWQWRKQYKLQFRPQHYDININSSVAE
tara:strand:+ start:3513 stop:4181 length:669 start_codon:yes stop_codon:yes gene_type:complete